MLSMILKYFSYIKSKKMDNLTKINKAFLSTLETVSLISTESIIVKHQRAVRTFTFELESYIDHVHGFIDPDFPHSFTSINQSQHLQELQPEWLPAELIEQQTNYSESINSIESDMFCKKVIAHALTLINWFAHHIFSDIFLRELSSNRLYTFDVMIDGVFIAFPIDSYIPLNHETKTQIFTKHYKGSIFPCLYQKLLAKIYGDYYSITQQFIDIVELQTCFCREQVSITQGISLIDLQKLIERKINEKSLVSFRTRNSIRLSSFGLQSNHVYVVLRIIEKGGDWMVEFLELDGESWIGKGCKLSSNWLLEDNKFLLRNSIVINNEEVKQNYMGLSDLKGLARQLVILNNTTEFHKNYFICDSTSDCLSMYRFELDQKNKIMVRVNYKKKKCYNSIFIIEAVKESSEDKVRYKLVQSSFRQNKDSNYVEATLNSGEFYVVIYNSHPQEHKLTYNLTIFGSDSFINVTPSTYRVDILEVLGKTFQNEFQSTKPSNSDQVFFKQLYLQTGMAFIYLTSTKKELTIKMNLKQFEENKAYLLNGDHEDKIVKKIIKKGKTEIFMFRCLWSKTQNIVFEHDDEKSQQKIRFPPVGSVKVTQNKEQ